MCKNQGALESDRNKDTSVDILISAGGGMLNRLLQKDWEAMGFYAVQYNRTR